MSGLHSGLTTCFLVMNLRLSRKCIYQNLQRHLQIKDGALDFWTNINKQQRSIALSTKTRTLIIKWWTMETTMFPKRKKVCRKRLGMKQVIEHPNHFFVGVPSKKTFRALICSGSILQMLPRL